MAATDTADGDLRALDRRSIDVTNSGSARMTIPQAADLGLVGNPDLTAVVEVREITNDEIIVIGRISLD